MIHALSSMPHFAEHLEAVWKHLPEQLKGEARHVDSRLGQQVNDKGWDKDDIVMVASYADIFSAARHRVIYVEHGAGQSYVKCNESANGHYHGSRHPDNVVGYLGPRQQVINSWAKPGFACGSPVCDPYQLFGEDKVVAITFHWPGHRVCPEAGTAFEHYVDHLPEIVAKFGDLGYGVLGHAHPRFGHLERYWKMIGVPLVDVDTVRRRASVLMAENTSLLYELAYLGRQIITLNCPQYRRDINHGLRFWDAVPGWVVDSPEQLLRGLPTLCYMADPTDASVRAYGKRLSDGNDGLRAAAWLSQFVAGLPA